MKISFKILTITLLISVNIYSQGCSDAGFCTLQNTKEVDNFLTKHNTITLGMGYGMGLEKVKFFTSSLEYGYAINEKISLSSKLTYQNATGTYGSNSGLGDAFLTANYRLSTTNIYDFRFLVGGKFPLNNADSKTNSGFSLPMDYQTSLGTYDLIIGGSMIYDKNWEFGVAAQIPVGNKNENQFSPIFYTNTTDYVQTTGFKRKSDALFRVGYFYQIPESRLSFKPNVSVITHLGKDTYKDFFNNEIEIKGSEGYTINLLLNTILTFRNDSQLTLALAAPSITRTANRPDGLTRIFGLNLQYSIKF
jgi:hypothetical protein